MKRLFSVLVLVAIAATIGSAGQWSPTKRHTLRTDDGDQVVRTSQAVLHGAALQKTGSLSWVSVDSANNVYGAAGWNISALSYDPGTNYLGFVHRGQSAYGASGQLFYNVSTDGGVNWSRVAAALNAGIAGNNSRYPSGAILNQGNQAAPAQAYFVYANPELTGGAFGAVRYGVDPLGAGTPGSTEVEPPPYYSSQFGLWTDDVTGGAFWVGLETDAAGAVSIVYHLFSTLDVYGTVSNITPEGWADSTFQKGNKVGASTSYDYMNGDSRNGHEYVGLLALFAGDTIAVADTNFQYNYNVGYAKSTDNGVTWGAWVRPEAGPSKNWNGLPGFGPSYYIASGYTSARADAHLVVDSLGLVHFFTVVVDTTTSVTSVVEIYETSPNVWADKVVKAGLNRHTIQIYGALDQDSWDLRTSVSPNGKVLGVAWLDAATSAATDTLPDIWFAHRSIDGTWNTPENLTQSTSLAEFIVHAAPSLKANGGNSYTVFLSRAYQLDFTGFPPGDATLSEFLVSSYTFNQIPTGVSEKNPVANTFTLKQNYPNPFNPATRIEYAIPRGSNVKVIVYNVLGQEVATLVNEFKNAGTYSVDFNASRLASGVYMYSIKAGSYTDVKKMVLLK